jgi:hypothetical protein
VPAIARPVAHRGPPQRKRTQHLAGHHSRFPFTEFKEAIELMKSGNSGKIVLDWSTL